MAASPLSVKFFSSTQGEEVMDASTEEKGEDLIPPPPFL